MLPCIARINWFLSLREVDHAFLTGCAAAMLPWQTHSTHTQLAGDNKKMAAINICILLRGDPGCRLAFTRALPTRRAFPTHPLRSRALARALTQYVTGYGIPLCHGFPLWDNHALRIRCLWWRASFCPCSVACTSTTASVPLIFCCAMLLCRDLLCALHFPRYFFCVYLYVFLQCSGFRLPTPTSPTSVREGCVCLLLRRLSLLSLEPCRNGRGETVCPTLLTRGGVCCPLFKV